MLTCNRLPVPKLALPYGSPPCLCHHFQLQSYVVSATMVHRRRLRRRHRRHPFATYFMYLYQLISIDLQSSRSCNSSHCKSLHKLKLLLNTRQYSTWNQFLGFSRYFRFLIDVSRYSRSLIDVGRYLVSVKFSGIVRSVKSSRFLRYRVDISRNLRLNRFLKF